MVFDKLLSDAKVRNLHQLKNYSELRNYIGEEYASVFKRMNISSMTDESLNRLLEGILLHDCPLCSTRNLYLILPFSKNTDLYTCDYCKKLITNYDLNKTDLTRI